MKLLFKILIWIAGIIGIFLLIGAFLPGSANVSRSITIKAPATSVYGILNDLKTYNAWMPWNQKDSAMKVEWGPQTSGTGAWYSWQSSKVGTGKITIVESVPDKLVTTSLAFGGFDQPSVAGWDLVESGGNTTVTWKMTAELSHNPVNRWFGLFFGKLIGPDFENGLSQLKEKIENGSLKVQEPKVSFEKMMRPAMQVLTIMDTAKITGEIGPKLQKAYGEMGQLMKNEKLSMSGAPFAWYYTANEPFILEAAVPVDKAPANTSGRVHFRKLPAGNAVVAHFFGPYDKVSIAYTRLGEWVKANNLKASNPPYEVYVDDPTTKKSMYEVQTDIVQPVN
ncbi:SRPBCC family protein [Flavihumibacter profundi]|uniref:SRPBCC family protein n=1 Tax=Flavihumibacter profundi TaxID=2716883 RepID=UPI001CC72878|nr:SRPBCC family protein [Flavihumibacter profundi]MBZ5856212.1 SRPBCC family protein [Flavihumibacter profundi]